MRLSNFGKQIKTAGISCSKQFSCFLGEYFTNCIENVCVIRVGEKSFDLL